MPERFLALRRGERAEILQTLAVKLGRTPVVLEKDVWVCWTLTHLFAISGRQPMAFKGGTSLSKVYGAIARFSEDLDVTLDCRALAPDFDPFSAKATTSSRKNHRERLVKAMAKHVREVVDPALRNELKRQFQDKCQAELDFPVARVDVLRPERTFWEKATLVHAECGRGELRPCREKLSRHWYDLSCLAEHDIGRRALADRALLVDVVKYKTVFYAAKHADYAACLEGRLPLVPPPAMMAGLRSDLEQMIAHGMFEGRPPPFDEIMARLRRLESAINKLE